MKPSRRAQNIGSAWPHQPCCVIIREYQNQQKEAPIQVNWKPIFHLPSFCAAITAPRACAKPRNQVMKASRARIGTSTHQGK